MSPRKITKSTSSGLGRKKFLVGGVVILAAVAYLVVTSAAAGAQYFYTVDELQSRGAAAVGKPVRISGAVLGDSIQYDPNTLELRFTIVNMPADAELVNTQGGLAEALHQAVLDTTRTRLQIVYIGVRPDLLKDEAQAILSGKLGDDGIFYANELLLRCPTRYQQALPGQADTTTN